MPYYGEYHGQYLSTIWSVLKHNVSVLECVLRHWSISIGVLVVMLEQKGNNAEVLDIRSSMVAILDECLSTVLTTYLSVTAILALHIGSLEQ